MKLIIDIPDEMYDWAINYNKFYQTYSKNDLLEVIQNGKPVIIEADKKLEGYNCEDCISRQAAKRALEDRFIELQKRHDDKRYETNYCLNTILELPPVTRLSKTGHWEQYGNSWEDKFKCSECGIEQPKILCGERIIGHWSDYCPHCGAKMVEPQESEE